MTNPYEQYAPTAQPTQPENPYAQYATPSSNSANPYAQFSPSQPSAPSDPNFFQRVGQDWKDNYAARDATDAAQKAGKIGVLQATVQQIGEGPIGYLAAPVTEGFKSISNAATDAIGQGYAALPSGVTGTLEPAVNATGDKLSVLGANVSGFLAARPQLARDLQSLQNVAAVMPMFKAGVSDVAAANSKYAYNQPPVDNTWQGNIPPADNIFAERDKAYEVADNSGTGGTAQAASNYIDQAQKAAAQSPYDLAQNGPDAVQKYLDNMENVRGRPMPIADAQEIDKLLRENAKSGFNSSNPNAVSQAARWKLIRQSLRDNIYNQQDPALLTGGPEGFNALQEGNRLHSMGKTVATVENGIKDGLAAEVPQQGVKQFFKGLSKKIDDGKWGQGLSDETVAAINYAGKTGALTGALKTIGNKLGAEAGGAIAGSAAFAAHPVLAIPGYLAGKAATIAAGAPFRAGATAIQLGKANDVLRTIIDNPKFTPPSVTSIIPPTP